MTNQTESRRRLEDAAPDLLAALKELSDMYGHAWELVGGGLMMTASSIPKFERAHAKAIKAIAKAEGK